MNGPAVPGARFDPIVAAQKLLPQHWLSRAVGRVTRSRRRWIRRPLIALMREVYGISLEDAARKHPHDYASFEDFFTRELADGARPLPEDPGTVISPADGSLRQHGTIADGTLLQSKGIAYSLAGLVREPALARRLEGGCYATIYLAPADYHRVHVPFDATLTRSIAVPGALFSVNARSEAGLGDLFCRNERLVCCFDSALGPIIVVLVGALIVAGIETVWDGPASPYGDVQVCEHSLSIARGAEIARFRMGSSVILLLPPGGFTLEPGLTPGRRLRMGDALAYGRPA